MVATDKLIAILDFYTEASLFAFSKGSEFDQSLTVANAIVPLGGEDYGYDEFGTNAAPVAPRKSSWKFFVYYGTPYANYTAVRDAIIIACGHNRPILLEKTRPDGVTLVAEARLADFPDRATIDSTLFAEFTITFDLRGDWYTPDVASPRYDTGLTYNSGQVYDAIGLPFPLSSTQTTTAFTLTNNGNVNDRQGSFTFFGPTVANVLLANTSADVRGAPISSGLGAMGLTIALTLASGEYLTIDAGRNAISSNHPGVVPRTIVTKAAGQRHLFELLPGANAIVVTQGGIPAAGGSLLVLFHSRYRT